MDTHCEISECKILSQNPSSLASGFFSLLLKKGIISPPDWQKWFHTQNENSDLLVHFFMLVDLLITCFPCG